MAEEAYDIESTRMPIVGATITLNCPTCGAAFDVHLDNAESRQSLRTELDTRVPFRCPECEHLGEMHLEIELRAG